MIWTNSVLQFVKTESFQKTQNNSLFHNYYYIAIYTAYLTQKFNKIKTDKIRTVSCLQIIQSYIIGFLFKNSFVNISKPITLRLVFNSVST